MKLYQTWVEGRGSKVLYREAEVAMGELLAAIAQRKDYIKALSALSPGEVFVLGACRIETLELPDEDEELDN
jgi:hypothetical protein